MGGLALLLASIGIYGVMAYSVSQRRHEIGIRMAMGARGTDVLKLVLGQGMALVVAGLALGLGVAVIAGRNVAPLLYGVSPTDVTTFAVTSAVLALVALIATLDSGAAGVDGGSGRRVAAGAVESGRFARAPSPLPSPPRGEGASSL